MRLAIMRPHAFRVGAPTPNANLLAGKVALLLIEEDVAVQTGNLRSAP